MDEAQKAFEAADAEIKRVIAAGEGKLDLNGVAYHALEVLPERVTEAVQVTKVNLDNTQISDLRLLAKMTQLTRLDADNTQVSDLGAVSGLTGLQVLYLNNTPVADLGAVSGLTGLQGLYLNNTPVSDLGAVSGLTGLQGLNLNNTPVSDLGAVSGLTELRELYLNNTQVSDLGAVSGLTGLQELYLNNTPVSDLGAVSGLTELRELYLNNTQVSDLGAVSGLTELRELYLNNTQVSDPGAVSGLTELRELYLENTPVSDLGAVSGLTGLQGLNLNNTPVSDLGAVSGLTELRELYLNNTQVSDLGAVSGLTGLQVLDLTNTQVADLGAVSGLMGLQVLYLNNTQVSDLGAVSGLTGLQVLYLNNTQVSDLRVLTKLKKLIPESAHLRGTGLNFQNTAATRIDPELKRLSKIEFSKERAEKTLAYLEGLEEWPPGGGDASHSIAPEEPDQEPVLRVVVDRDGVELAHVDRENVVQDRVAQKALEQLRAAVDQLALAAGNLHFGLATDARRFAEMLAAALDELDLIDVYNELERLREVQENRAERAGEDVLSTAEIQALRDIGRAGPSLVIPDEEVQVAMTRQAEYYGQSRGEDVAQAQERVSESIGDSPELFGGRLRRYQAEGGTERNSVLRWITVKNAVIAVVGAVSVGAAGAFGTDLYQIAVGWLGANVPWVQAIVASIGDSALAWAAPVLQRAREAWEAAKTLLN